MKLECGEWGGSATSTEQRAYSTTHQPYDEQGQCPGRNEPETIQWQTGRTNHAAREFVELHRHAAQLPVEAVLLDVQDARLAARTCV